MKQCKQCGVIKNLDKFSSHAFNRDGLQGKCKSCRAVERKIRESKKMQAIPVSKVCLKCNKEHLSSFFLKNKSTKDGLNGWCKRCTKDAALQANYSITIDEYESLLTKQSNCCAICGTADPKGPTSQFVVDHCHKTGKVRGLLCNHCNTGLGKLGDTVESLTKAIRYLSSC